MSGTVNNGTRVHIVIPGVVDGKGGARSPSQAERDAYDVTSVVAIEPIRKPVEGSSAHVNGALHTVQRVERSGVSGFWLVFLKGDNA